MRSRRGRSPSFYRDPLEAEDLAERSLGGQDGEAPVPGFSPLELADAGNRQQENASRSRIRCSVTRAARKS